MSKDSTIQVSNFSVANLRGERMSAFTNTISQAVSSEIAQAMLSGKAMSAPKAQQKMASSRDRKAMSISEVVLKHMGKLSSKDRRRIAGSVMSRDIVTGQKLTKANQLRMKSMINTRTKIGVLDDEDLIKRLTRILRPAKPIESKNFKKWNVHWNGILHGVLTGPAGSSGPGNSSGSGSTPPQHTQLQFRLHEVICNDDTREMARDEIAVGAVSTHGTTDENDNVTSAAEPEIVTPHDLGQYRTGDRRTLGPLNVETFTLSGLAFPRLFLVNLALAEVDSGGFANFLQDLYDAVEEYLLVIISAVGLAIGAAIGAGAAAGGLVGTVAGPIGSLIGAAIGVTIGAIIAVISMAANDDIFEVQQCAIELPSRSALFNGSGETPIESLTYMGFGGEYTLRYNWRLT